MDLALNKMFTDASIVAVYYNSTGKRIQARGWGNLLSSHLSVEMKLAQIFKVLFSLTY